MYASTSRHQPTHTHTHTHTHTRARAFNGPLSGTTRVSRYQRGKSTNLDFTEARENEWQWQQLGHMQVCISHQTDNHASTPPLSFLQAGCHSCRPINSVKALKTDQHQPSVLESLQKRPFRIIYSDMDYHTSLFLAELDTLYSRGVHGNGKDWDPMGLMGFPWEWE